MSEDDSGSEGSSAAEAAESSPFESTPQETRKGVFNDDADSSDGNTSSSEE